MLSLGYSIEFQNSERAKNFLDIMSFLISKLVPITTHHEETSRHYFIKKVNRYGIKQKRITWFDFNDNTFNISNIDNKGTKKFDIRHISHFTKKGNSNSVIVDFCVEIKAKSINLVFFNDVEMNEYIDIAQKLQQSIRESKFQGKQSVIFKEVVANNKESRKFTWLAKSNTNATSIKNQNHQFYYNVLQIGVVSNEKRYLSLNTDNQEILFLNNRNKVVKKLFISSISIKYHMQDPLRLQIFSLKSSIELIFPSVYLKYHFASNFYMKRYPEKIAPSLDFKKEAISVYVCS